MWRTTAECPLKKSLTHFSPFLPWQYACCGQWERRLYGRDFTMEIQISLRECKTLWHIRNGQIPACAEQKLGIFLGDAICSECAWMIRLCRGKTASQNEYEYLWISVAAWQSHSRKRTVGNLRMCGKKSHNAIYWRYSLCSSDMKTLKEGYGSCCIASSALTDNRWCNEDKSSHFLIA